MSTFIKVLFVLCIIARLLKCIAAEETLHPANIIIRTIIEFIETDAEVNNRASQRDFTPSTLVTSSSYDYYSHKQKENHPDSFPTTLCDDCEPLTTGEVVMMYVFLVLSLLCIFCCIWDGYIRGTKCGNFLKRLCCRCQWQPQVAPVPEYASRFDAANTPMPQRVVEPEAEAEL